MGSRDGDELCVCTTDYAVCGIGRVHQGDSRSRVWNPELPGVHV